MSDEPLKLGEDDDPFGLGKDDDNEIKMTESTAKDLEMMGIKGPFKVGGKEIEIVPDIEARESTVICMPKGTRHYFKDDVEGTCNKCGIGIYHRPHVPIGSITICTYCYAVMVAKGEAAEIPDLLNRFPKSL